MKDRDQRQRRIEEVIRQHCRDIQSSRPEAISSMAHHIIVMCDNAALAAGVSEDVIRLEELARSLKRSRELLGELSTASKRKLNYLSPPIVRETKRGPWSHVGATRATSNGQALELRQEAIASLVQGIGNLKKEPAFKAAASNRRNYRAALVAAACIKVWREEIDPERKGKKEPPKQIHPDRSHPMGDLIQDVFDVLSIGPTPASALNSLDALGGEEALILSIEEG